MSKLLDNKKSIELNNDEYKLEWFNESEEDWEKYIGMVVKSNISQSWGYGKAKEKSESWRVRRGLIKHNSNVIAIFQALEKSLFSFKIIRINRGPLLINGNNNFEIKYNIYRVLQKKIKWWKGKILLIAPELIDISENTKALALAKFWRRKTKPYKSIWLDLIPPVDKLRSNLKASWRRNLLKSEKKDMSIEVTNSERDFKWLMKQYNYLMKKNDFIGSNENLITEFYLGNMENCFIFKVSIADEPLAGVLMVRHGAAFTYWVGWNGDKGRNLRANHFLFWNVIVEMKKLGCLVFDLGGIDEENTPGITQFKRGLGGKEYTQVGEWIAF